MSGNYSSHQFSCMINTSISINRSFLMGMAIFSIIIYHCRFIDIPIVSVVLHNIGHYGVDLFLFLSGFGCTYSLSKTTTTRFYLKRALRIFPTCFIIGFVIYILDIYLNSEKIFINAPLNILSLQRWYIQAILIYYMLCPLFLHVIYRFRIYAIIAITLFCIIAYMTLPDLFPFRLHLILQRMPVFCIGIYFALFDMKISKLFVFISCLFLIIAILSSLSKIPHQIWPFSLAFSTPFICIGLSLLKPFFEKIRLKPIIETLGVFSLELYLTHEYASWCINSLNIHGILKYALLIVIITPICYYCKKTTESRIFRNTCDNMILKLK